MMDAASNTRPSRLTGGQQFRALVEHSPNAIVVIAADGRIELVNAQAERLFGYSRDELLGEAIEVLVPERFRHGHVHLREQFMQHPQPRPMGAGRDLYGLRSDGVEVPIEIALTPIRFHGTEFVVATITDITLRKRAEENLRASEQRLRWALQGAGGGAWDWNLQTGQAWWSTEMYELMGVPPGETMMLENSLALIHQQDRQRVQDAVQNAIDKDHEYECEYRIRRAGLGERWILALGRVIKDTAGRPERMLGISLDVTERRRAEESLRQADQMKTDFIRVASHELRTPVSFILGMVKLLSRVDDPDRLARGLASIAQKAARLNDIILAMFKLTPDQLRPDRMHYSLVSLPQLIEQIRTEAAVFLEERRQRIHIDSSRAVPLIQADRDKIRDVLENLVMNAVKFTPDGGDIHIDIVALNSEQLQVSVRDQGGGIAPRHIAHLFQPFYTGGDILQHSTGVWQFGKAGVGLGLAIARQFVHMHAGTIDVRTGPEGSTFTVTLPVRPPARTG